MNMKMSSNLEIKQSGQLLSSNTKNILHSLMHQKIHSQLEMSMQVDVVIACWISKSGKSMPTEIT